MTTFCVGSTVEVFTEEDKNLMFTGIFFQDQLMKTNFDAYPEALMVDAACKLNECLCTLCQLSTVMVRVKLLLLP